MRELYFNAEKNEAVLVLESPSVEDASHALSELPLVHAGLIDFDLIPLKPYPGFVRLFSHEKVAAG